MSKNQINTDNELQKRNHTNTNGAQQRKNIFQLIEPLNKNLSLVDKEIKNQFVFAENLITFLKNKHPKELSKLSFNKKHDDINILIGRLTEIIIDLNYTIVFDNEGDSESIRILYPVGENDFMWYLLEFSWIDEIESEELKIGYCYLMDHIGEQAYINVLKYDYIKSDDNCFESEFDMILEQENYLSEDNDQEVDEGQLQEAEERVQEDLQKYRKWKEKFLKYKDNLNVFLQYNPKNENEEAFKNHIIKGLNLDYSVILNFMPIEDIENDGGTCFAESILLFFDCSEGVEEEYFEGMQENANNGACGAAGWYVVDKGKVESKTSEEDIKNLKECFQYIVELYDNHLIKLKKK